ncbi:hypothetical protein LMG27174_05376 [Paraburkholderia rhynchosiae]|uniref:Uncharacterized protein n=1 Tax=Paraburkholderia rhynchosiae TaxID=487049 RepID=A0A6J5C7Q4_9BURK|nr:hypothetical protein LMG27174_05376 [Paraburkholderia rhynchosiae]
MQPGLILFFAGFGLGACSIGLALVGAYEYLRRRP